MNARTKYLIGFFGACVVGTVFDMVSVQFAPEYPALRWASLFIWGAVLVFAYWWMQRHRGKLPQPTPKQLSRAARSAKRLGWMYIIGVVLAYLAEGDQLIHLPYGLGFVLPVFPLALATYHLRLAARLSRQQGADDLPAFSKPE